jgi:hypothetical protein
MPHTEPQSLVRRSLGDIAATLPGATAIFRAATSSISAAAGR